MCTVVHMAVERKIGTDGAPILIADVKRCGGDERCYAAYG
ncbi:Hypothetical protein Cp262_2078 [Corynebacterium pseudotuberculosis]|nr:Hypothetical protein Cp262_2078 [Corynebacterium pseudotuberculosis]